MDFKDQFKQLAERFAGMKNNILTEEATKNAFVMPFIMLLGYDVFNPTEVVPEMDCDIARKKGEKIDYAIIKDNDPIMLFECKHWQQDLNLHETQLSRYFVSSKARFGVLTNGLRYRFYTDLDKTNIMDKQPFLEIDFENYKDAQIEELKKFHKSYFDVNGIVGRASELKHLSELRNAIREEFTSPSPEFVKHFAKKVYSGTMSQRILEQFSDLVKRSLSSYINDIISDRLNTAMQPTEPQSEPATEVTAEPAKDGIVTTEEEMEGYRIVKSILQQHVDTMRITYRDHKSYFSVLIDDNNRKTVCRLYFDGPKKYIGIITPSKGENWHQIQTLADINNHQDELKQIALKHME